VAANIDHDRRRARADRTLQVYRGNGRGRRSGNDAFFRALAEAARSGWSQGELAARPGVAKHMVYLFEAGRRSPTANVLVAMRRAIDTEGIRLIFDQDGRPAGILLRGARIQLSQEKSTVRLLARVQSVGTPSDSPHFAGRGEPDREN
jgi:transcriptional regulator with XRE-family HTH domain